MNRLKYADHDPQWLVFYTEHIHRFWQHDVEQQRLTRPDGVTLSWYLHRPVHPIGLVVISPGRIEASVKYQELVWNFAQAGYAVAIIDHRGQGLSDRLSVNPQQGHVERFSDYVDDFAAMMQYLNVMYADIPKYLLAHSMGAAIASLYLLKYPHAIERAAFTAPMFGIQLGKKPKWFVKWVIHVGALLNRVVSPNQPWYVKDAGDYHAVPFADNELTHSAARYQVFRELYEAEPRLQLGGPTYQWVAQAFCAIHEIQQRARELQLPLLIIQAGGDTIVDNAMIERFFKHHHGTASRLQTIEHAKHELLLESDCYRDVVLDAIWAWFQPSGTG